MALSDKQQRFVAEYLKDLNATQAAIRAGYSERSAGQVGHANIKKHEIAEAIAAASKVETEKAGITVEWVLGGIKAIGDKELAADPDRLKAYELGGKYLKLWTEKHEHKHNFDDLTDEQLEQRFKSLTEGE